LSLHFLGKTRVLTIFWTVTILPPISILAEVGFYQNTRGYSTTQFDPIRTKKESSDMKRTIFVILAAFMLAATTGCLHRQCREKGCSAEGCSACTVEPTCDPGCAPVKEKCVRAPVAPPDPGPPTGAVAYPYYNLRGPRDFLARNPASIGP
jgi:hypothetical protein